MRTVYGLLASLQLCIGWTADELPAGGHQLGYKSHHQGKGGRECFVGTPLGASLRGCRRVSLRANHGASLRAGSEDSPRGASLRANLKTVQGQYFGKCQGHTVNLCLVTFKYKNPSWTSKTVPQKYFH